MAVNAIKKISARAKQIQRAYPKKTWLQCIKQASAEYRAGKKPSKKRSVVSGKSNPKYEYFKIIQQNSGHGWDDVDSYECDSRGEMKKAERDRLKDNLKRYRENTPYPTRVIFRKEKKGIGAVKFIERGEKKSTPAKKTYRINRTKKGTFKGMTVAGSGGMFPHREYAIQKVIMRRSLRVRGIDVANNIPDRELEKLYRKITGRKPPSIIEIRKKLKKYNTDQIIKFFRGGE